MEVASPPGYRRFSLSAGPAPAFADELPPYTRPYTRHDTSSQPTVRREPTEHVYHLTERNRTLVTLKLYSSAKSPQSLPTFFEKENIAGLLEVNAEKGDSIHAITAIVTGRIITGPHVTESFTFLSQSLPIWSKSADVPRVPSLSQGASLNKLLGSYQWPLSITLPRKVNVPDRRGVQQACSLPETFLERHTPASVQYDFTILVSRGKLRTDSQIRTAFGYVPMSRPGEPSILRQLAYQSGHAVPGPLIDPDGWHNLRSVIARGTLGSNSKVEVQCLLSLSIPLCYTRGSIIPCFLTLQGDDSKTLDLFAHPSAISVYLQRRVGSFCKSVQACSAKGYESLEDIGHSTWWPAVGTPSEPNVRHLEGELKLPKDLRPTTSIGPFSVSYQICFRSFNVESFRPDNRTLISEAIEIATMHARGPRPRAYSPPAYCS